MAVTRRTVDVPPAAVFAVLRDGYSYADWVVGTAAIRSVGIGWPAVGTLLHFSLRLGPLEFRDRTMVLAMEPDRALDLRARARPFGTARVAISLRAVGGGDDVGTEIAIDEHPVSGPGRWLHNPLVDWSIHRRNHVTLRRLSRLAVERANRPG